MRAQDARKRTEKLGFHYDQIQNHVWHQSGLGKRRVIYDIPNIPPEVEDGLVEGLIATLEDDGFSVNIHDDKRLIISW